MNILSKLVDFTNNFRKIEANRPSKNRKQKYRRYNPATVIFFISIFLLPLVSFSADNFNLSKNQQVQILSLLQDNEKQLNMLTARVRDLIDNYSTVIQSINQLNNSLTIERKRNVLLERKISILQQQVLSDREQVSKSIDNLLDKVAIETSKSINTAINKIQNTKRINAVKKIERENILQESFTDYKVQPGATLSAISKAYRVSVSSIKKANNLSSDFIKIGQILRIPNQ